MRRNYTTFEAKRVISRCNELLRDLKKGSQICNEQQSAIKNAAEKMVGAEVMRCLRDIPLEELNRDKKGIRIKALQDCGYNSIADIAGKTVYQLSSIYGISEDSARTIRHQVDEFIRKLNIDAKIKISTDNKTRASTDLVKAIAVYLQCKELFSECKALFAENVREINRAIDDLTASIGGLRRLFSSKAKKQLADDAYLVLEDKVEGDFGSRAEEAIRALEKDQTVSSAQAWNDFTNNSVQFFNVLEDVAPGVLGTDDAIYGLPEELAKEIQDQVFFPDGLLCELRGYQKWGVKYALHQEKVLLGDEMGLGKTVQAIATMVSLKNTGATHFMVVCPLSVLTNWVREISTKSRLSVTKIHGSGRQSAFRSWMRTGGVAITTYETTGAITFDEGFTFSMIVVDEAHYIKNTEAKRTVNTSNICLHAERLLFMTGTALENNVDEMLSLMRLLQPDIANKAEKVSFMASAPQFRKMIAPVYYRRKREDVLTELPEKIESNEWCTLSGEEEVEYEKEVMNRNFMGARRVSFNVDDISKSSKMRRLQELVEEAESEGRKILVFSFFLDTVRKVADLFSKKCMNPINGSVSAARRQEILDEFEKAPAGAILPAQIQSGGTGLNIQSASVVIICEPQLKPSIENQAISRAYRMGQVRNVLVYRLLCENTIDERITKMLEEKQAIFDAFADKSEAAKESIALDEKTIGDIIQEEIDRINAKRNAANRNSNEIQIDES